MKAKSHRVALGGGSVIAVCLGLVLSTAAFRCPGPDPMAAPSTGGSGGSTTETTTDTSTSTTTVASSSSGCSPDLMTDPMNCGACGRKCNPMGTVNLSCSGGVCNSPCGPGFYNFKKPVAPAPDDGCEAHDHHVFLTAATVTSDMNGMPGALGGDAFCQQAAMNAGIPTLFPWKAWLSDDTTSPAMRFNIDGGPYVRIDLMPIAPSWMALTTGPLQNPINIQEDHMPAITGAQAWTGTGPDGNVAKPPNPLNQMPATNCINWSSVVADGDVGIFGDVYSTGPTWTLIPPSMPNCISQVTNHLYCFEQ